MTDKLLLEDCLEILEMWVDGETPYQETNEMIKRLTARFTRKKSNLDHALTERYEKCKELMKEGNKMLKDCCKIAGITPDQWYRRQRMEEFGVDREKRRYDY